MDENVVYNNNQSNQTPQGDPPAPEATPSADAGPAPEASSPPAVEQAPAGTAFDAPADPQPLDPNTNPVDPQAQAPADGAQLEAGAAPPPPPPPGFLGGNLKKILIGIGILIFVIVIIALLLPKGGSSKQQVKLEWWGLWEETSAVQTLIADFKKTHPNIDVEYQKRSPQEYKDRLLARIDNGSGPDIFRYHNTWLPILGKNVLPLSSDVISPSDFSKNYYPVVQKDIISNGAIYGIPLNMDSIAMFVNPELFDNAGVQVPNNWDDFVKVSKQLTVKDSNGKIKTAGAALGTYENITHAPDIMSLLFVQQGVKMDKFTADPKSQADAITFYTSFAMGTDKVWDTTLDNSTVAFSKGNLAIYFGYSWDVFAIQKLNPDLKFKIYPVPGLPGKRTTIASYWVEGVNAKSKNKAAALEFMKYLAQKETAEKFYAETAKTRTFGEPYPRKDLRENLREVPLAYPFLSQVDDASSTMFSSDTHDGDTGLNTMMNSYLSTAISDMINETTSSDKTVQTLNNGVAQVYKKFKIKETK